jgi:hypothetical protein
VRNNAEKILTVLVTPLAFACAGSGMLVPVFLPGERMDCLFEVVGELTVQGPFRGEDDGDGASREAILQSVRLDVGREAAGSGADAVMVRELLYNRDATTVETDAPEILAVEGMLVSFVDQTCIPRE